MQVLLVEDNYLAATTIMNEIEQRGGVVVGPHASVDAALQAARECDYEVAVLDIKLADGSSVPVAQAARSRGLPVIFISGYCHDNMLTEDLARCPMIRKPVPAGAVCEAIAAALAGVQREASAPPRESTAE